MKVIFDSNVWRPIVSPSKFPNADESFKTIRNAIENGEVEAFIRKAFQAVNLIGFFLWYNIGTTFATLHSKGYLFSPYDA